ncbi:hypothetical protein DCAR_0102050 [Daucus carota subsp. sativus]|uniref:Uncharacterized protein n=1 Tax=Daucus carota subsp. sativus TaxID=79200 RepID=A0A166GUA3_DAUCS|nr:hypothetical protein DCAR_0102050 [Daucus carota subsp. sativus]
MWRWMRKGSLNEWKPLFRRSMEKAEEVIAALVNCFIYVSNWFDILVVRGGLAVTIAASTARHRKNKKNS